MIALAVLISVYKNDSVARFECALKSILDQDLPGEYDVRVYLGVDGPVCRDLEAVIDFFRPQIYRVVRSQSNEGLASTLNNLLRTLEDEQFIFRMDADDISSRARFRQQLDFLKAHPEVDILGTDIIENDVLTGSRRVIAFAFDHNDAVKKITRRVPVAHPTVCFRRRVFHAVPQYPSARGNEDVAMWFACLRKGLRFGNVHEPLLEFTVSTDFWSRRGFRKAWSEFVCYIIGTWRLHGLTWHYVFPIGRLFFRFLPSFISKFLYKSTLRYV